eukprot:9454900-Pyramimonas_sp.AAC.1
MEKTGLPPGCSSARAAELAKAVTSLEALGSLDGYGADAGTIEAARGALQRKVDAIRAELASA